MRQAILTGVLAVMLVVGVVGARTGQGTKQAPGKPATAAAAKVRAQDADPNLLGTVRLARNVLADGQPLAAGTYQVRLTADEVKPAAGATPDSERWVEFIQGGQRKGRELCSLFANDNAPPMREDKQAPPPAGQARVQMLRGGEYLRVWFNRAGQSYLIHLPLAK